VSTAAVLLLLAQIGPPPPPAEEPKPDFVLPIVHALGLETLMRIGESILYPDPFSRTQYFGAHYREAFTKPPIFDPHKPAFEWDGDPWTINLIGHGFFGSELYLRARMCHLRWYGSLAFAAAGSTLWEYAFEGNGVRPSVQDLVYTPLMGFAAGEGRYVLWNLAGGIQSSVLRHVTRAVVDPFGELERAVGTSC
jgi:hypothetical protein